MKYAKRVLVLALMLIPGLAMAQLSGENGMVTRVPFDFVVGNRVVPAGRLIVQSADLSAETIVIRNPDQRISLFSAISPAESTQVPASDSLVFHKYGDRYFLAAVKIRGTRTMYQLPESKAEAELRERNVPSTEEMVHVFVE